MNNPKRIVTILAFTGAIVPLLWYHLSYGCVASLTPLQAKSILLQPNSQTLLVDIRPLTEYNRGHIQGARHWAFTDIQTLTNLHVVPEPLRDQSLLLYDRWGQQSVKAAATLQRLGLADVKVVRGGLQEWIGSVAGPQGGPYDQWQADDGTLSPFPTRVSPLWEKLLAVFTGFGVKYTYMALALLIAWILRKCTSVDLVALRWSMLIFFLGEAACAVNYILFQETSYLSEFAHAYGMLLSFAFVTYAVLEGIDRRILQLSDPNKKCAALSLCKRCIKYETVPCGLRRIFHWLIGALIVIALIPLAAAKQDHSYNTMIFGTFYHYTHRVLYQQFEMNYCPLAAFVLLTISLLTLLGRKPDPLPQAKIFLAAGIGPLSFGLFRTVLIGLYHHNLVWFNAWEEITELIFIMGVGAVLWIFRNSLLSTQE